MNITKISELLDKHNKLIKDLEIIDYLLTIIQGHEGKINKEYEIVSKQLLDNINSILEILLPFKDNINIKDFSEVFNEGIIDDLSLNILQILTINLNEIRKVIDIVEHIKNNKEKYDLVFKISKIVKESYNTIIKYANIVKQNIDLKKYNDWVENNGCGIVIKFKSVYSPDKNYVDYLLSKLFDDNDDKNISFKHKISRVRKVISHPNKNMIPVFVTFSEKYTGMVEEIKKVDFNNLLNSLSLEVEGGYIPDKPSKKYLTKEINIDVQAFKRFLDIATFIYENRIKMLEEIKNIVNKYLEDIQTIVNI